MDVRVGDVTQLSAAVARPLKVSPWELWGVYGCGLESGSKYHKQA